MSLCGGLGGEGRSISAEDFEQNKVTFDDFVAHLQVRLSSLLSVKIVWHSDILSSARHGNLVEANLN